MNEISLYVHIPFCSRRCSYCDFVTFANRDRKIDAYVDALCEEIRFSGSGRSEELHTIYFGGGTPSKLSEKHVAQIIDCIWKNFSIARDREITFEVNPGTITQNYLSELRTFGVNRISLGMQSGNAHELKLLERIHDLQDINNAVKFARKAGFDNISLDLIYGLPQQSLEYWMANLDVALMLEPEHISFYGLTLEGDVPMQCWVERGLISACSEDMMAEMYEKGTEFLTKNGFMQYEISNFALKSQDNQFQSRHNLQYWRNYSYIGVGIAAHGYIDGYRYANINDLEEYIALNWESFNEGISPAISTRTKISRWDEIQETMMVGMRLTDEGVSREKFEKRFGVTIESVFSDEIDEMIEKGMLENPSENLDQIRLTRKARIIANQVFMKFLKD